MRVYVRLFAAITVPCAVAIVVVLTLGGFILSSETPWTTWALLGAELGAGFAALAAAGLGTAHRACVRDLPCSGAPDAYDLTHVRALTLELPYGEAFDACVSAARTLGRGAYVSRDRDGGTIEARTLADWRTSGERASFAIEQAGLGRARVKVSTRPAARLALVDYGASLANIERIVEHLRSKPRWPVVYR